MAADDAGDKVAEAGDKLVEEMVKAVKKLNAFPDDAPPFDKLMLTESLYQPITIDAGWRVYLWSLRYRPFQFDAHCIWCGRSSTFKATNVKNMTHEAGEQQGDFERSVSCSRYGAHTYTAYFRLAADGLQKIGQYPSIQSVAGAELRQYKSVLEDEDFSELNKATGLFSHGVGIGSFVYLRRIFERMVDAHRAAQEERSGPIASWKDMRMDERIGALKDALPPALVKNKAIYGILSKGIHELSEDQCKAYFPIVRAAIILILQQDLDAKRRATQEAELQKRIASISGEIKK